MAAEELNQRDWRIMELVADGRSNRSIGQALGLTETTIKNYMVKIMDCTGMDNRAGVAVWFVVRQLRGEIPLTENQV